MIIESTLIIGFALLFDLIFGDPKSRYHPTAWIGKLIGMITTRVKNENQNLEKFGGIFIVVIPVAVSCILLSGLQLSIDLLTMDYLSLVISILVGMILLKMTTILISKDMLMPLHQRKCLI